MACVTGACDTGHKTMEVGDWCGVAGHPTGVGRATECVLVLASITEISLAKRKASTRVNSNSNATVLETRLRVRYAETDQMNVVYHSNYVIWFEVGRVEFMRQLGFTYREMEQQDQLHLPVVEVRCRFKAPARYDDELIVRTHIARLRSSLIQFQYEILRADDGLLLAEGESTHVAVDAKMEKTPFPEKYMSEFRRVAGRAAENTV